MEAAIEQRWKLRLNIWGRALYKPSVCLVTQGAKRVQLGDDTFVYDAHHFLITALHRPTVVQIVEASKEKGQIGWYVK